MKLLVISDTHGQLDLVRSLLAQRSDFDMLLHLGDYLEDGEALGREFGLDVLGVPGNMDGCMRREEGERILPTEGGKILLTHGHLHGVKGDGASLLYRAEELGCRAVFFGHTHASCYEEEGGLLLLNPGSAAYPRDGNPPSYAVVQSSEEGLECGICFFREGEGSDGGGQKTSRPGRTGRLSSLLNYSDRF